MSAGLDERGGESRGSATLIGEESGHSLAHGRPSLRRRGDAGTRGAGHGACPQSHAAGPGESAAGGGQS
jgi:hypothetical protein